MNSLERAKEYFQGFISKDLEEREYQYWRDKFQSLESEKQLENWFRNYKDWMRDEDRNLEDILLAEREGGIR